MTAVEVDLAAEAIERIDETLGLVLGDVPRPGPWVRSAACRTAPSSLFFIGRGEDASIAKRICAKCGVREQCLEYALDAGQYLHGIWGGTSDKQRRRLRAERAATPSSDVEVEPEEQSTVAEAGALYRTLEALTEHPLRWARVAHWPGRGSAQSVASMLRNGYRSAPPGSWLFEGRRNDVDGGSDLYAMYAGDELEVR